ncbi:MAG: hypothetical protein CFE21_09745 [Bacteroidetes bacterium B1(2017)]|nr:MAG: hypothetical protein CFE21_09745 [Bacteroidetes bacterium B1(2017)]
MSIQRGNVLAESEFKSGAFEMGGLVEWCFNLHENKNKHVLIVISMDVILNIDYSSRIKNKELNRN